MNLDILPSVSALDSSSAETAYGPVTQDALFLHNRLEDALFAFNAEGDVSQERAPPAPPAPSFADAVRRQGDALHALAKHICGPDQASDVAQLRGALRETSDVMAALNAQAKSTASAADAKFEALTEMMAVISGHLAAGREETKRAHEAITALSEGLRLLSEETQATRAEAKELRASIHSINDALTNDLGALVRNVSAIRESLGTATQRLGRVEDRVSSYADIEASVGTLKRRIADLARAESCISELTALGSQMGQRVDTVAQDLKATRSAVGWLNRSSEKIADGLRATDEGVAVLMQREKAMAALLMRAAGVLQTDAE